MECTKPMSLEDTLRAEWWYWKKVNAQRYRRTLNGLLMVDVSRPDLEEEDPARKYIWFSIWVFLKEFTFAYKNENDYDLIRGALFLEAVSNLFEGEKELVKSFVDILYEIARFDEIVYIKDVKALQDFPVELELIESRFWGVEENDNTHLLESDDFLFLFHRSEGVLTIYICEKEKY